MKREDLRGAMREDMLPERSTMNTTSGFKLFGRVNFRDEGEHESF